MSDYGTMTDYERGRIEQECFREIDRMKSAYEAHRKDTEYKYVSQEAAFRAGWFASKNCERDGTDGRRY